MTHTREELERIAREQKATRAKLQLRGEPVYHACATCVPDNAPAPTPPRRVFQGFSPGAQKGKPRGKRPPPAAGTSRFLFLPEVAERCRAPIGTVRHWIRTGRLHAVRPGRRVMVDAAELERFLRDAGK